METTPKRFSVKNWLRNWLLVLFIILLGFVTGAGWDTLDNSPNFTSGFNTLVNTFGGITSFGALVGAVLIVGGFLWGVRYMIKTDFTGHKVRGWLFSIGTIVAIIFAGMIGWSWFRLPSGTGWTTLSFLMVPGVIALFFRNVRSENATGSRQRTKFSFWRKRNRANQQETATPTVPSLNTPRPV
jgi:hypothetical protein